MDWSQVGLRGLLNESVRLNVPSDAWEAEPVCASLVGCFWSSSHLKFSALLLIEFVE